MSPLTPVLLLAGDEKAAASLRTLLSRVLLTPLARAAGADRPELRAGLIGSQMIGLAMARDVVRLGPVASAEPDELAPAIGPTLDRYLTGPLGSGQVRSG